LHLIVCPRSRKGSHLALASNNPLKRKERVSGEPKPRSLVTEKYTPEVALRIRIKGLPAPGEFDEFDLRPYRVGLTYQLPMRLASLLILGGYAEQVGALRTEAADFGHISFSPKTR
jgi:hypothetical protein